MTLTQDMHRRNISLYKAIIIYCVMQNCCMNTSVWHFEIWTEFCCKGKPLNDTSFYLQISLESIDLWCAVMVCVCWTVPLARNFFLFKTSNRVSLYALVALSGVRLQK